MLFFIIITMLFANANAKFYTDCGSKAASVQNVTVSGCTADAKECVLPRESNTTFSIQFTPFHTVDSVVTLIHGTVRNMSIPVPLSNPDACVDTGLVCPLQANMVANYERTLYIRKQYPKIKVEVKYQLKDEHNVDLVCILIPSRIGDPIISEGQGNASNVIL